MSVMNDHYAAKSAEFYKRYYSQLEGATINRYLGMRDGFPVFELLIDDGAHGYITEIEVSADPEGNGGGFLFGLMQPDMSDWTKKTAVLMAELEKSQ